MATTHTATGCRRSGTPSCQIPDPTPRCKTCGAPAKLTRLEAGRYGNGDLRVAYRYVCPAGHERQYADYVQEG